MSGFNTSTKAAEIYQLIAQAESGRMSENDCLAQASALYREISGDHARELSDTLFRIYRPAVVSPLAQPHKTTEVTNG